MIDIWEQLEVAIAHNPAVISLDATLFDAIVAMHSQSDIKSSVSSEQTADGQIADDADLSDAVPDELDSTNAFPVVTLPASRYVVVVERDQVVGLLTERDIGLFVLQQLPLEHFTIRQVLRHHPITIKTSALSDLVGVLNLFQQHQLTHLPVVDNDHRLVGVISAESLHQILRYALGTHHRISSTEISNTEMTRIATAPKDSQKQFQRLAENFPGTIYRLVRHFDGDYELTYVSPHVQEMFEVRPEKVLRNINAFWERIHPDDLNCLHSELQISAHKRQPFKHEHRLNLPQKGLRWVRMSAHPEHTENGDVVWDGIVLDIGARKQVKAELKQTIESLDRATQLKDEFLANMSYALRTPLNTILGITEGLRDGIFGQLNPQQVQMLKSIEHSGAQQLALINEILDLAKIESRTLELTYSAVAVTQLCQSSLAAVKQQALEKGIQLHLNLPWNLPDIRIDERRIRQVLVHILNGAIESALSEGNVTLKVVPSPIDENKIQHYLRFSVIDSGIGSDTGNANSVALPLAQTTSRLNTEYESAGLGLALIEKIVELHGGQVAATSDADGGNQFTIELPYDTVANNTPTVQVTMPPRSPASETQQVAKATEAPLILLAEDNEANIFAPSSYLQAKGYRIQIAKNGQAAIELAQAEIPQIILMDIQMPGMDGLTAIQHIRQLSALKKTPIIALTAFAMEGDQERCLAAGANKYLSKPVKLKQLVSSIQELIA
ncbi:MAG: response regulator [Cyanobacteria bacterium P01_C01_bin.121]